MKRIHRLAVIAALTAAPLIPFGASPAHAETIATCTHGWIGMAGAATLVGPSMAGVLMDNSGKYACVGSVSGVFTPDDATVMTAMTCTPVAFGVLQPTQTATCTGQGTWVKSLVGNYGGASGGTIKWTAIVDGTEKTGGCHVAYLGDCSIT